jgi:hypothetical protein
MQEAQGLLTLVGQPHAYLIEELSSVKSRAADSEAAAAAARALLAELQGQVSDLALERDALRRDLDTVLTQRAGLNKMKQIVMRAVGAGGGGISAGVGGAAAVSAATPFLIQGTGVHGNTSILQ